MNIANKTLLITGTSRGLGRALVTEALRRGAKRVYAGARTDEYLAAMRAIWTQPKPTYHGQFVSSEGIQAHPQRNIPIVVGGHTPAAYRRAALQGTGWYGFALDISETTICVKLLQEALQQSTRPTNLGKLEISITPRIPLTRSIVRQFADLGVQRLILMPPTHLSVSQLEEFVMHMGETVIA